MWTQKQTQEQIVRVFNNNSYNKRQFRPDTGHRGKKLNKTVQKNLGKSTGRAQASIQ